MRIVAVADTHLFHDELVIPEGDVFVHAGDLCRGGDLDELRVASDWITSLPHRYKIVVAGNHDWAFVHDRAGARGFANVTFRPVGVRRTDALARARTRRWLIRRYAAQLRHRILGVDPVDQPRIDVWVERAGTCAGFLGLVSLYEM